MQTIINAMRTIFILFCTTIICSCNRKEPENTVPAAPMAKKIDKVFTEHGNTRHDPYFWLGDRTDSNVINHLRAENTYTEAVMKHTESLRVKIYDELVSRIEQKYESLPVKENGYWYYTRYEEGQQYPRYCRKKGTLTASEETMLDVSKQAAGHQIYLVRGRAVSRNNNWLAFAEDTTGNRTCTTRLIDLQTGTFAADKIPNTSGSFAWSNDGRTLYYTTLDHTVRSNKVFSHILGTNPVLDKELYTENDSTYSVYLNASKDNKYIFIISESTTTSEARFLPGDDPDATPVLIQPRQKGLLYYPDYYEGNYFHIFNNHQARNFKLSVVPIASPALANWKDIIAHQDSGLLENVEVLKDFIVAQHKIKGLSRITVINRADNSSFPVEFNEDAYVAEMSPATDDYQSDSIRYSYTSLTTPAADFGYNLRTKRKTLLKQRKVGGGFDASKYATVRVWARAADGTSVPVSLVYRKENFRQDGSNPMLLYAYGSYGYNSDPYFNSSVISLLDRGFVYGIAHVRGGQEMGRYWYEDGKLLKKKNTFTDFIDCAQFLINEKYTSADKLFANGGSAGGMLMGAVINMRHELFRGVIAEVPWMDVITDSYNPDLPLVTLEYDEWGDPHKKEYYDYMLSWSPYDNVKKIDYPAILATGGLNDTQVLYYSPAKWVQKVRENNTGSNPVLFQCNMGAGHGGESGRFEMQKLTALKYAFMLDQLGRKE
jgi:oligopeptidase B